MMTDPENQGSDIDALFAAIVADFTAPAPRGSGPWPASEDLADDELDDTTSDRLEHRPGGHHDPDPRWPDDVRQIVLPGERPKPPDTSKGTSTDGTSTKGAGGQDAPPRSSDPAPAGHDPSLIEDEEEGYVPPIPPPLPRGDLVSRLAWSAVIGGPLFLLLAALTWRTLPSSLLLIALLAFIAGFVTLVARMPPEPPDDPEDGAVV